MRQFLDLTLPPTSIVWRTVAGEDRVYVSFRGENKQVPVIGEVRFGERGRLHMPEAIRLSDDEVLADVSASPGGVWLLSARRDRMALNAVHQLTIRRLTNHTPEPILIDPAVGDTYRILPGGRQVAVVVHAAEASSLIEVLDTSTGDTVATPARVDGGLTAVAFAPDGSRVVGVRRADRTACCWSVPDGRVLWTVTPPPAPTGHFVAFSGDGRVVVFCTHANRGHILNRKETPPAVIQRVQAATGQPIGPVCDVPPTDSVSGLAVSHDGRLVVTSGLRLFDDAEQTKPENQNKGNTRYMRALDVTNGSTVYLWPDSARVAFAPDRYVLAVVETNSGGGGRLGFWHFDAPAKK